MKLTELSFVQLEQIVEEFNQTSWKSNSLIRKVCISEFGNDGHAQMLGLAAKMLPILISKIKELEK
jgi:hypothetical protein